MKLKFVHSENSSRLILIYAGWGMDDNLFKDIRRPGYDIAVVWDYRSLELSALFVDKYSEICVIAWSMGVFAASRTAQKFGGKITLAIAINGTTSPVSDTLGIPEAIFYGTLENLSETTLEKFFRRMSHTAAERQLFDSRRPDRGVDELREELKKIGGFACKGESLFKGWDLAYVGEFDRIFPLQNQLNSWQTEGTAVRRVAHGHHFDFQNIIDEHIIDKSNARNHFKNSVATYEKCAASQADVVERLMRHIEGNGLAQSVSEATASVLEIGSGSGLLSRRIACLLKTAPLHLWDFAAPMPEGLTGGTDCQFSNCDAETEIAKTPAEYYSHIFSSSAIQWFNSPEKFLSNCYRALKHGGYAFLTTYTSGNMREISELTGVSLPLLTARKWEEVAGRHFKIIVADSYVQTLEFESPADILRHLRLTGVNSLGAPGISTSHALTIVKNYPADETGKYRLTYTPYVLILKKE